MKKNKLLIIVIILGLSLLVACGQEMERVSKNNYLLGTVIQIDMTAVNPEEKIEEAFAMLSDIEKKMSLNIEESEISQINAAAGKQAVEVSDDTFKVIKNAIEYAKLSEGRFDPSIGPIVDLWAISEGGRIVEEGESKVPGQAEIKRRLELVGFEKISLNEENNEVFLEKEGMMLDIGGIAKGYAADKIIELFAGKSDVKGGFISLGGSIVVFGEKEDQSPWRVGIQDPIGDRGAPLARVKVRDMAVDTSGNYERYFIEDGERYHHILSTTDGYPVDAGVISATIVTESSFQADALSTVVFTLGVEKGLALVDQIDDTETMIVNSEQEVYISQGLRDQVEILSDEYQIVDF